MASKKDGMEVGGAHRPAHLSFTPSRWVIPVLGDALALPVRDRSFDAVVCFEVIKQLPDVAGRGRRDAQGTETPGALDLRASEPRIVVDSPWKTLSWVAGGWRLASTDGEGHCNGGPGTDTFLYRKPVLDGVTGGDGDAVYYCSPLDLMHHLSRYGARLVETSAHRRFGWPGCCSHRSFKARRCLPGLLTDQSRELVPADCAPHRAPARPRRGSPGCDPRVGEASEAGCRDYMAEVRYTNGPMSCSPSCYRA